MRGPRMKRYRLLWDNPRLSRQAEALLVMASWRYVRLHPMVNDGLYVEAMRIASRPKMVRQAVSRW